MLSLELVEVEVDVVTIEEVVVCSLELVLEDDWLGAGDILVLCTLHDGILAERKEFLTSIVSKDDVTIHLITAYERRYIMFLTHLLTYLSPLAIHLFMLPTGIVYVIPSS